MEVPSDPDNIALRAKMRRGNKKYSEHTNCKQVHLATLQPNARLELTPRDLVAGKFVRHQIHAEALVLDVAVPIPAGPDVQAHRRELAAAHPVRGLAVVRIDAVEGLDRVRGERELC